jgi:addiction module RelE/StbE family toxin
VRRLVWTAAAVDDLDSIRAYIAQFSPLAAQRIAARLKAAAERLDEHAERGRRLGAGRRELVIVPPYLIRYRLDEDTVYILQIRHGARRPD